MIKKSHPPEKKKVTTEEMDTASLKSIIKEMRNVGGCENGLTTEIIKHAICTGNSRQIC